MRRVHRLNGLSGGGSSADVGVDVHGSLGRGETGDAVGRETVSCGWGREECAGSGTLSWRVVRTRRGDVVSEWVPTTVLEEMTVIFERAGSELRMRALRGVVPKLLLLLLHVVDVLLVVHRMLRMMLRMMSVVTIHHHTLLRVMNRVLLLLLLLVMNRSLRNEHFLIVLATWTSRVSTRLRRWGSTMRRRRRRSPIIDILVFLDIHQVGSSDTNQVPMSLRSHLGAHLRHEHVEFARDDDVEPVTTNRFVDERKVLAGSPFVDFTTESVGFGFELAELT